MSNGDFFLKLDTIDGESADEKYGKWIDVQSFSWGTSNTGSSGMGGGAGSGKVNLQDFHFNTLMSKASTPLFLASCTGQHIPKGEFVARKAGGKQEKYLHMKFHDILVSSYQTGAGDGSGNASESISLNMTKVEIEYFEQQKDGSTKSTGVVGWDQKKNVKV